MRAVYEARALAGLQGYRWRRQTHRTAAGMAHTKGAIERSSAFKDGNEVDECSVDCGRGLRTRELTAGNPAAVEIS